jgi:hypothetical protein
LTEVNGKLVLLLKSKIVVLDIKHNFIPVFSVSVSESCIGSVIEITKHLVLFSNEDDISKNVLNLQSY